MVSTPSSATKASEKTWKLSDLYASIQDSSARVFVISFLTEPCCFKRKEWIEIEDSSSQAMKSSSISVCTAYVKCFHCKDPFYHCTFADELWILLKVCRMCWWNFPKLHTTNIANITLETYFCIKWSKTGCILCTNPLYLLQHGLVLLSRDCYKYRCRDTVYISH